MTVDEFALWIKQAQEDDLGKWEIVSSIMTEDRDRIEIEDKPIVMLGLDETNKQIRLFDVSTTKELIDIYNTLDIN